MYPRFRLSRAHKLARRTAGDVAFGTSWQDADTALDLVLAARVGDIIRYTVQTTWSNENSNGWLDVGIVVGGVIASYFGLAVDPSSGNGLAGWYGSPLAFSPLQGGGALHTVVSGDLSGGKITLRLRGRGDTATKSIQASATIPLIVFAENLGPAAS